MQIIFCYGFQVYFHWLPLFFLVVFGSPVKTSSIVNVGMKSTQPPTILGPARGSCSTSPDVTMGGVSFELESRSLSMKLKSANFVELYIGITRWTKSWLCIYWRKCLWKRWCCVFSYVINRSSLVRRVNHEIEDLFKIWFKWCKDSNFKRLEFVWCGKLSRTMPFLRQNWIAFTEICVSHIFLIVILAVNILQYVLINPWVISQFSIHFYWTILGYQLASPQKKFFK